MLGEYHEYQGYEDAEDDLDEEVNAIYESRMWSSDELQDADLINRMLGHMRQRQRQMARDKAVAEAQIARVQAWLDRRTEIHQTQYDAAEKIAQDWHAAILRDNPKRTFISFPNGDLKATKQQDEWVVDDDALLAWIEEHEAYGWRRAKYAPARDVLKKAASGDHGLKRVAVGPMEYALESHEEGVIDGITVVVRPDKKLTVKLAGDE